MEKKDLDWGALPFGYVRTDYRYESRYTDGSWDEGGLVTDSTITLSECAGVFQYAQTCFEGLKVKTHNLCLELAKLSIEVSFVILVS